MDWIGVLLFFFLVFALISLFVQAVQASRDQKRALDAGQPVGSLWQHMVKLSERRHATKPSAKAKRTSTTANPTRAIRQGWSIGQVAFTYEDSAGDITHRTVTAHSVTAAYIKGECHDRRAERTFRIDRIIGDVTDCDTGEILSPKQWARRHIQ